MSVSRPPLPPPDYPVSQSPAVRGVVPAPAKNATTRTPTRWHRERQRGAIVTLTVIFLLGALLSLYGVHRQISQAAARAEARSLEMALATGAALQSGMVLFVPQYGNLCRRRWIDNATWMIHDGGQADCGEASSWHATNPPVEHKVGQRLDAIRSVFQNRAAGKSD